MKVMHRLVDNEIQHFDAKHQRRIFCDDCNTLVNWKRWGGIKFCNTCKGKLEWYGEI